MQMTQPLTFHLLKFETSTYNFTYILILVLQTTKDKKKPNAIDFFVATHTNKDGQLDEGAQKVVVSFLVIKQFFKCQLLTFSTF